MTGVSGTTAAAVDLVASSAELLSAAAAIADDWRSNDATGSFLARNLVTGQELGFNSDAPMPLASVAKVPLALVVLDAIESRVLDGAAAITIDPRLSYPGTTGIATFRHPLTIAVADLVTQSLTVSDNIAADSLLELVGIDTVNARLREWGVKNVLFRHNFARMYECALGAAGDDFGLALELAIQGDRPGGDHVIETMNTDQATVATASALVDLLQRVWADDIAVAAATAGLRQRMSQQLFWHRLASDLRTDSYRISSKTGSFLNLRHEIGVVEADSGERIAIAALTRCSATVRVNQGVDLAIGAAARRAVEALR